MAKLLGGVMTKKKAKRKSRKEPTWEEAEHTFKHMKPVLDKQEY